MIILTPFFVFVYLNLITGSYEQASNKFLVAFGDSATAAGAVGGYSKSYPLVAANLLQWSARNFARDGQKTTAIPGQLLAAASVLPNATHVTFTIGGNDIGVADSFIQIISKNNFTAVAQKVIALKSKLISTYKLIQNSVSSQTKIYALPYVDLISVGNKVPNEADCHRLVDLIASVIAEAAAEVKIGYISAVKTAFIGHEIRSTDPYADDYLHPRNAAHPNAKGYAKIGEVVANYLRSE